MLPPTDEHRTAEATITTAAAYLAAHRARWGTDRILQVVGGHTH